MFPPGVGKPTTYLFSQTEPLPGSQALADDLKHIRTSIVKAELAKRPLVAMDLLVFQMGGALLGSPLGYDRKALEGLSVSRTATHSIPRSGDAEFAENNKFWRMPASSCSSSSWVAGVVLTF